MGIYWYLYINHAHHSTLGSHIAEFLSLGTIYSGPVYLVLHVWSSIDITITEMAD